MIRGYTHSAEPAGFLCVAAGHAIAWQTEVARTGPESGPGAGRFRRGMRAGSRGGITNFTLHFFANSREFTIAQTGVIVSVAASMLYALLLAQYVLFLGRGTGWPRPAEGERHRRAVKCGDTSIVT